VAMQHTAAGLQPWLKTSAAAGGVADLGPSVDHLTDSQRAMSLLHQLGHSPGYHPRCVGVCKAHCCCHSCWMHAHQSALFAHIQNTISSTAKALGRLQAAVSTTTSDYKHWRSSSELQLVAFSALEQHERVVVRVLQGPSWGTSQSTTCLTGATSTSKQSWAGSTG
jgi:hypothetical protein